MRATPTETELKLACTAAGLEKLKNSRMVKARAAGTARTDHLVTTYFDTEDDRLARRRVSLRVRRWAGRCLQTLKAGTAGAVSLDERMEWEVEVDSDTPDIAAFNDPRAVELVGALPPGELRARYASDVHRVSLPVVWVDGAGDPARVEIAFDQGRIIAGEREELLAEVEIELIAGSVRALYEIAARLRRIAPMRLGGMTKAARGYALSTGRLPQPQKAGRLVLDRDTTVDAAMLVVFRRCLAHAVANEAAAAAGLELEGVHQLRVALRRLRSALSLFRPALPQAARMRWTAEARWLLRSLGPCRDLDVLLHELIPTVAAAAPDDAAPLGTLAALGRSAQQQAQQDARAAIGSRRCGDLLLGLACWAEQHGWRSGAEPAVASAQQASVLELSGRVLDRLHRRVRKRGRGFVELAPVARHELRLAVKKLRYGLDFFADLYEGKHVGAYLARTAELQESLGRQNDMAVSRQLSRMLLDRTTEDRRSEACFAAGLLAGWQSRAALGLESRLTAQWDEFRRARPFWRS